MAAPDHAPEPQVWLLAAGARAVLAPPDRTVLGAARSIQDLNTLAAI
jgi:3-(3-hydroxy-phenyl)propionate hydroxylase